MAETCEPSQHGAEPVEQREHISCRALGRETKNLYGLECCRRFRGFAASAAKAGQPIASRPAGRFRDAQETREQSSPKLIAQARVTTRNASGDCIPARKRLAGDRESIQAVVVEARHPR